MAELSARQIALTALRLWRKEKHFADFIISGLLTKTQLNASDRGFALELFYGVLRNLTLLDFWVACVLRASTEIFGTFCDSDCISFCVLERLNMQQYTKPLSSLLKNNETS